MGFSEFFTAADGKSIDISSLILLCLGAAMVWKYARGFTVPPIKPEVQLSAAVWNDLTKAKEDHEKRISRIEGRLRMYGGDNAE